MDYLQEFNDACSFQSRENKDNNIISNKYQFVEKYRVKGLKRPKSRTLWASGQPGTRIRDAKTGFLTEYIIGVPADEAMFFKVSDSRGKFGLEPLFLYYDSPESYESHFGCELNTEIKEKWFVKRNSYQNPTM